MPGGRRGPRGGPAPAASPPSRPGGAPAQPPAPKRPPLRRGDSGHGEDTAGPLGVQPVLREAAGGAAVRRAGCGGAPHQAASQARGQVNSCARASAAGLPKASVSAGLRAAREDKPALDSGRTWTLSPPQLGPAPAASAPRGGPQGCSACDSMHSFAPSFIHPWVCLLCVHSVP